MGDHRAGNGTRVAPPTGKRVARHAAEQTQPEPYVGRRIARAQPTPPVAAPAPAPVVSPAPAPVVTPAPVVISAPVVIPAPTPTPTPTPALTLRPVTLAADPAFLIATQVPTQADLRTAVKTPGGRVAGKRVARRRSLIPHLPSAPVLMGIAILGISAGGALQAVHPGLAGAADGHHLAPASALSGSSAVSSASLVSGRGAEVSRDANRVALSGAGSSLQAQADAQLKQRNIVLSQFAAKAQKQSAKIQLHQWVLPVQPGVYHLTARFGDYSPLWSHFHTGLDFAAPTGTPIMAVAGGTITDVGYSGAYGNRTIETLPDGTELWYCHQNEFGTTVGATVRPGQVIGYVGSTGNVTGPHLHLEVHPGGGDPVDPMTALEVHGLQP
jgi:hypothetical protein